MTVCLVDALLLTSCCCSSSDQILVVLAQDQSSHSPGCSGVVGAGPAKAMVHHAAVLRLQAVGDVLLHLLTAPQEPAAIPSQLLPWAPPVLLLLSTDEDLVHVVREAYLRVRPESTCKPRAGQLLQGGPPNSNPKHTTGAKTLWWLQPVLQNLFTSPSDAFCPVLTLVARRRSGYHGKKFQFHQTFSNDKRPNLDITIATLSPVLHGWFFFLFNITRSTKQISCLCEKLLFSSFSAQMG